MGWSIQNKRIVRIQTLLQKHLGQHTQASDQQHHSEYLLQFASIQTRGNGRTDGREQYRKRNDANKTNQINQSKRSDRRIRWRAAQHQGLRLLIKT